jgi:hypothetical protein
MLLKSVRDQQTNGTFGFSPKTPALPNTTSPIVPTKSPRNTASRSLSEMSVALDLVALSREGCDFKLYQAGGIGKRFIRHSRRCGLSIHSIGRRRLGCYRRGAPRLHCSRKESLSWAGSNLNTPSSSSHRSRARIYTLNITGFLRNVAKKLQPAL